MSKPGFLGYPNPPIAFAPGHDAHCFLPDGTYVRCVTGCAAQRDWPKNMASAYAAHDAKWTEMRGSPPNRQPPPDEGTDEKEKR